MSGWIANAFANLAIASLMIDHHPWMAALAAFTMIASIFNALAARR